MKCCICGTVKNCELYLDKVFENIEKIGSLFEDYVVIFSYDKSVDWSLDKLKKYKEKNHKVHLYVNKNPQSTIRTVNIANARNKCLELIRKKFKKFEYFAMIDCDDVSTPDVNIEPLRHYLTRDDWDGLTFNRENYYDLWAFSKYPLAFSFLHFLNGGYIWKKYINDIIAKTPPNELIPCISAFNGFAIYRTPKFINCTYDGTIRLDLIPSHFMEANVKCCGPYFPKLPKERGDCEHRSFHYEAIQKNDARIRIAPEIMF